MIGFITPGCAIKMNIGIIIKGDDLIILLKDKRAFKSIENDQVSNMFRSIIDWSKIKHLRSQKILCSTRSTVRWCTTPRDQQELPCIHNATSLKHTSRPTIHFTPDLTRTRNSGLSRPASTYGTFSNRPHHIVPCDGRGGSSLLRPPMTRSHNSCPISGVFQGPRYMTVSLSTSSCDYRPYRHNSPNV